VDTPGTSPLIMTAPVTPSLHDFAGSLGGQVRLDDGAGGKAFQGSPGAAGGAHVDFDRADVASGLVAGEPDREVGGEPSTSGLILRGVVQVAVEDGDRLAGEVDPVAVDGGMDQAGAVGGLQAGEAVAS